MSTREAVLAGASAAIDAGNCTWYFFGGHMGAPQKNNIPIEKLELYDKLIATNPLLKRKGVSVPYTSLSGHMFSYLNSTGLMALRLPKTEREGFLKKFKTSLFEAHGIIQKEFVTVPDQLLKNTNELRKYFDLSYAYIASLKPKPTKKASKKKR